MRPVWMQQFKLLAETPMMETKYTLWEPKRGQVGYDGSRRDEIEQVHDSESGSVAVSAARP